MINPINNTLKPTAQPGRQLIAVPGVACILATMGVLLWPRLLPMVLPAVGLLALVAVLFGERAWRAIQPGSIVVCLTMFGAYLLTNASWSADPGRAFGKAGLFFLLFVAAYCAISAVRKADSALVEQLALGFALAAMLVAAIVLGELLTDRAIMRGIYSYFPAIGPTNPKDITIVDGEIVRLSPHNLNRNITVLNMILWPALLALTVLPERRLTRATVIALLTLTALATFASEHTTSKLALAFAAIGFVVFRLWPGGARVAVAAGWVAATMLVVPAAHLAYGKNLHMASWLPVTSRARIILWEYTADQVEKAPVLGIGLASTRKLDEQNRRSAQTLPDHVFQMRTGHHAHNIYLQTWYELGLVGALLLLVAGFAVVFWIIRLPAKTEAFVASGFISSAVIGAFGWGMWQSWFMAACFMIPVFAVLAVAHARETIRPNHPL